MDLKETLNKLPLNGLLSDDALQEVAGGFSYQLNESNTELHVTLGQNEKATCVLGKVMLFFPATDESRTKATQAAAEMDAQGIRDCTIFFEMTGGKLNIKEIVLG